MAGLTEQNLGTSLAERLALPPEPGCRFFWLGQAGFVLEANGARLVIDPYLSDSLAEKYRNADFSHERMMPPPVDVAGLGHVDLVLSTHRHTDHMDPQTLRPLFETRSNCRLVAPAAEAAEAEKRSGLDGSRILYMDAGDRIRPMAGIEITATPSAHETCERDAQGRHRFLGYFLEVNGLSLWHSGDCIPFAGLVETLKALRPEIALLPVNGRRSELSENGVPGNFSIAEAIDIATVIGAKTLVAHHYGMFAFNTVDVTAIDAAAECANIRLLRARTGISYEYDP